jgi:hypothetical protein
MHFIGYRGICNITPTFFYCFLLPSVHFTEGTRHTQKARKNSISLLQQGSARSSWLLGKIRVSLNKHYATPLLYVSSFAWEFTRQLSYSALLPDSFPLRHFPSKQDAKIITMCQKFKQVCSTDQVNQNFEKPYCKMTPNLTISVVVLLRIKHPKNSYYVRNVQRLNTNSWKDNYFQSKTCGLT